MVGFALGLLLLCYSGAYAVYAARRGRRAQALCMGAGIAVCLALRWGALL